MWIFSTLVGIIIIFFLARYDKNKSFETDDKNTIWHINKQRHDDWYESYTGRKEFYKILLLLSLIPGIGYFLLIVISCIIILRFLNKKINNFL